VNPEHRPAPALPWRLADMLALYICTGIGFAILFVAWWGVSGTARESHQVPWVNVAVAGVLGVALFSRALRSGV